MAIQPPVASVSPDDRGTRKSRIGGDGERLHHRQLHTSIGHPFWCARSGVRTPSRGGRSRNAVQRGCGSSPTSHPISCPENPLAARVFWACRGSRRLHLRGRPATFCPRGAPRGGHERCLPALGTLLVRSSQAGPKLRAGWASVRIAGPNERGEQTENRTLGRGGSPPEVPTRPGTTKHRPQLTVAVLRGNAGQPADKEIPLHAPRRHRRRGGVA